MPHRTFTDAKGREWQVWNVTPHALDEDRRTHPERRTLPPLARDPERRVVADRRVAEDRRSRRRLIVSDGLESGWLAFETAHEKRRLAPVPDGWEALAEADLEEFCTRAVPARPRPGRRRREGA